MNLLGLQRGALKNCTSDDDRSGHSLRGVNGGGYTLVPELRCMEESHGTAAADSMIPPALLVDGVPGIVVSGTTAGSQRG